MRFLAPFTPLRGRALVGEVTDLRQLRQSPLSRMIVILRSWGKPWNTLHPYNGCLAALHATQYSSTLAAYAGFVTAFLSGGGAWCLLSSSRAAFSPARAHKSKNSSNRSKSGTALESYVCRCHSNMVSRSSFSSSQIDVTNEAKVSYFITHRARKCCLATS